MKVPLTQLESSIVDVLAQNGISKEDVRYWMLCDRTLAGEYIDRYLILTDESLLIITSKNEPDNEKNYKGYYSTRKMKKTLSRVTEWDVETLALTDVESVQIVNLVGSGMIVLKGEQDRMLASFSNEEMGRASKFASTLGKIKNKEEIDQEQLAEDGKGHCPKCGMLYPEEGRQVCPRCMKKTAIFVRLLSFAGQYKKAISIIVICMVLNSATSLVIPYLMGTVLFDQALGGVGPFAGKIALVVMLIILFRTLALVFGVIYGVVNAKMSALVAFDLKSSVFSSMQRLSLSFFQRRQTGQLMTRINNDAAELQYFFVDGVPYFIVNAMNIIGITAILLVLDWKLTLICFIPLPIAYAIIHKTFPMMWRMSWRRHRRVSAMNSVISDSIRGTRVVKAFGKEYKEIERFGTANNAFSHAEQSFNKYGSTVFPILNILTQTGGILIWAFGGWLVLQGAFTFGKVLTFVNYMYLLYGPIQFMNNIVGWWSFCMSAAQRIFEIQDTVPEVEEREDPVVLPEVKGEITVTNVVFGYEPNKPILKDVSLHALPGQMIGVVGHSGAGKSTLVNLISRLYDVSEGEIRIDGTNVKDLSHQTIRGAIGIVSQDVYVFSGSIAENISYAKPDCSVADIVHAAKIAGAHDFIEKLPDGYDTMVGTGGYNLSGGEKQRLSIARAILHNPRILVLDEATASLDTETELQIQEALETLIKGRTTIAIAHRLSTLRNADYLVVMDKGKVIEEGTHDQLIDKQGMYADLVKKHDDSLKMREEVIA